MSSSGHSTLINTDQLVMLFKGTRKATMDLCRPLERDDYMVQATTDTSPPKWHLGHTTWFFDNFILKPFQKGYRPVDPSYGFIFNSYYETVGSYVPKPSRNTISRPSLEKVLQYRELVENEVMHILESGNSENLQEIFRRTMLGINHEQQHQELLLMDIKRNFYASASKPAYAESHEVNQGPGMFNWLKFSSGVHQIGSGGEDFAFDNETPRHNELIHPFSLANRPVTNGEYLRFIEDGGYTKPELWLSSGWAWKMKENIEAPLYWEREGDHYLQFTFNAMKPLDPSEPVSHVSYYEADAFARWSGCNLPTESQWEHAVASSGSEIQSNYLETGYFRPVLDKTARGPINGLGNLWEWTASSYLPYPGYKPLPGSLGEYNGKFMSGQMVLRGASYATPRGHSRISYRNFYHPDSRWQFSGIRLSRDGLNE